MQQEVKKFIAELGHEVDETPGQVFVIGRGKNATTLEMEDAHKCPRCGGAGYGSYEHWAKEPRYLYWYYAHPDKKGRKNSDSNTNFRSWCYLGKRVQVQGLAEEPEEDETEENEVDMIDCPPNTPCEDCEFVAVCNIAEDPEDKEDGDT